MDEHQLAVRDVLARVNDAWQNAWQNQRGDAMKAALNDCFADDVVMRGPGFQLFEELAQKRNAPRVARFHEFL